MKPIVREERYLSVLGGAACALFSSILFLKGPSFLTLLLGLLGNLAMLPLFLLGLSRGIRLQSLATLVALGFIIILTNLYVGFVFFILLLAPSLLLTHALLQYQLDEKRDRVWSPLGHCFAKLVAYVLGLLFLVILFQTSLLTKGDEAAFRQFLSASLGQDQNIKQQYLTLFLKIKLFLPSISVMSSLMLPLLNAGLAQHLLCKKHQNLRPMPTLQQLSLPWIFWIAFAICGVGTFLGTEFIQSFSLNACIILSFVFLLEGLTIVHHLGRVWMPGKMFLWIFYLSMLLFVLPIFGSVIALGIFEPWFRLRTRWTKRV